MSGWNATCMTVLPPAVCYNPISSPVVRQTLGNLRSGWLCDVHSCLTGLFIAFNIPALKEIMCSFRGLSFQACKNSVSEYNWINQLPNTTIWWLDICCLLHRYQPNTTIWWLDICCLLHRHQPNTTIWWLDI